MTKLEASADDPCREDVRRGEDTLDGADTVDQATDPDFGKTDQVQKKPRKRKPANEPAKRRWT